MEQWQVIIATSRISSYVRDKGKSYTLPSSQGIWATLYGALVYGIWMIGNILHAAVHVLGCGPAIDSLGSYIYSTVKCVHEQVVNIWRSVTSASIVRERDTFGGVGRRLIGTGSPTNSAYEMVPANDEETGIGAAEVKLPANINSSPANSTSNTSDSKQVLHL
jgi:hypothetical protein